MYQLLVIQAFRPDRVIAAAANFVSAVLGQDFMYQAEKELDLAACVEKEIRYAFIVKILFFRNIHMGVAITFFFGVIFEIIQFFPDQTFQLFFVPFPDSMLLVVSMIWRQNSTNKFRALPLVLLKVSIRQIGLLIWLVRPEGNYLFYICNSTN